jgi:hypothetical protein
MTQSLLLLRVVFCFFAIGFGAIAVFELINRQPGSSTIIRFLRFSLGSNLAALFLSIHVLIPAQRVAMAGVYTAGLAVMAWRVFHLAGCWRKGFAFALTMVFYLDILALSVQAPGFATRTWWHAQTALLLAAAGLGIFAAERFSKVAASAGFNSVRYHASATHRGSREHR